jgi:hypothetical protein
MIRHAAISMTVCVMLALGACAKSENSSAKHDTPAHSTAMSADTGAALVDSNAAVEKTQDAKDAAPVDKGDAPPTPSAAPTPAASPAASSTPAADAGEKPKRAQYAPGVLIDWSIPQVEIDAKVVLRERNLELLLCKAGTKDHESILATQASAAKVFEALGLIGLTPGNPPSFDPESKKATPASGQRVAIELQTEVAGGVETVAAHEWMVLADTKKPVPAPRWVFCGSRKNAGGLAADEDGTIICVVDFDTALIGLGESHTSSDAGLWVATNTERIPEIGTKCTVIIRGLDDAPLELTLTPENYFRWNDRVLDALELDALIRERIRNNPDQAVVLTEAPGEPNPFARLAAHAIVGSGIKRENLTANLLPRPEPTPDPAAFSSPDEPEDVNAAEKSPAPSATPESPKPAASATPSPPVE